VLPWLPSKGTLLEIGAGSGWQAAIFARTGLKVFAIELPRSEYLVHSEFPTVLYDGAHIPFDDASFDVVYSSNVLEHIPHVLAFQREILRVLTPKGRIIHVLPTAAWRLATDASHYLDIAKRLLSRSPESVANPTVHGSIETRSRWPLRALFPSRHGEHGNWISETYCFSRSDGRGFSTKRD